MGNVKQFASAYEAEINQLLDHARDRLGWDDFEMRGRDHLDFCEVSKSMMVELLEHAFNEGGAFGAALTKKSHGLK